MKPSRPGGSVVIPPSWLGDAVLSLPAIEAIRGLGPVRLLTHPRVLPLFELAGEGQASEPFAGHAVSGRALRQARALRSSRPERVVVFPRSLSSALRAASIGAPARIGLDGGGRGVLLTRRVRLPWEERSRHIIEEFALLAEAAGAARPTGEPRIRLAETVLDRGREALVRRDEHARHSSRAGEPLVALCPGAAYGAAKRWSAARFAEIARRADAAGAVPILLGGPADVVVCREVTANAAGTRLIDLAGATDLATLAALLALSRVAIVNDSGPMHLAAAVGTPVVALFGSTNPAWTAPRGARHAVLRHPVACSPCYRRECPIGLPCFAGISADAAWSAVRTRLEAVPAA